MKQLLVQLLDGKWHFNGSLYKELNGIEKRFVDDMIKEVRLENFKPERTANPDLKNKNYQFNFKNQ